MVSFFASRLRDALAFGRFSRSRLIAFGFWIPAAILLVNLQYLYLWGAPLVRSVGLSIVLVGCGLLLLVLRDRWRETFCASPAVWIVAACVSYLVFGTAALFLSDTAWQADTTREIARQVFFFIVLLAVMLGGRAISQRIGKDALSKGVLATLVASCLLVLASTPLRDIEVLPFYRLPDRLTGAFTDANDAGFIGCVAVVFGLAFLYRGGAPRRAYAGVALGCAAALTSLSTTGALACAAILLLFSFRVLLLRNGFGRRPSRKPLWLVVPCLIVMVLHLALLGSGLEGTGPAEEVEPEADSLQASSANEDQEAAPASSEELEGLRNRLADSLQASSANEDQEAAPASWGELEGLRNRLADSRGESTTESSLPLRWRLWRMSIDQFLESPLVGNGIGTHTYLEGAPRIHDGSPSGVHNLFLLLLGEAGPVPFVCYLVFLLSLIRLHWTAPPSTTRDAVVGCAIVIGIFSVSFQHLLTLGASVFLIGLLLAFVTATRTPRELPAA